VKPCDNTIEHVVTRHWRCWRGHGHAAHSSFSELSMLPRVSEEKETDGLDINQHEETAYNN
jgi:ammonia channel protein AmtB